MTGGDTHQVRLVFNGRHARSDVGSMNIVGEADKRNILRDAQSTVLNGCKGGKTDNVVESKNGIRAFLTLQQPFSGFKGYLIVYLIADYQFPVNRQMVFTQGL